MWFFCFLSGLFCFSTVFKVLEAQNRKDLHKLFIRENTEKQFHDCPSVCTTANCLKKNQTGSFCCIFLSCSPSVKLLWSGWHVRATQRAPSDVKPKHSHAHQYTVIVPDTRMLMFLFLSKVRHLLKDRSSVLMLEKTLCCCVFLQV